jgi:catechol 2,3-dioxygenase-like lactoylglutathione lyase family enzyme
VTAFISHTTIDCADAYELSQWWKQLLGYVDVPDDPNQPGHEECLIQRPDGGHQLLFIEVPDTKQVKNRLHFDLRPSERTRDEEVRWALGIGASLVDDLRAEDGSGTGWVVLADPEGNEFCILRSEQELAAARQDG